MRIARVLFLWRSGLREAAHKVNPALTIILLFREKNNSRGFWSLFGTWNLVGKPFDSPGPVTNGDQKL